MLLHTPLLLAVLHTTQLRAVKLKPRPQLELQGQGFAQGDQSWQEVWVNQSSWSKVLTWPHCFQVPKCPVVTSELQRQCHNALGMSTQFSAVTCRCVLHRRIKMWIKWARTCTGGASRKESKRNFKKLENSLYIG